LRLLGTQSSGIRDIADGLAWRLDRAGAAVEDSALSAGLKLDFSSRLQGADDAGEG
jgi:hypothetical protein